MSSYPRNTGAEEEREHQKATQKRDAAFCMAMRAAGYSLVHIEHPQTTTVRVTRGEPIAITRGGSPASQCADLGSTAARGKHTSYSGD